MALEDHADAFVFVTPEYDHGAPASLVNALQYLVREWAYMPAGFVSYGGVSGGTRGVQQHADEERGSFDPGAVQAKAATVVLDELLRWAVALEPLRAAV